MADNIAVTAGSGETVGADEISAVKYQRVKIIVGADGTNDGDVASGNPMPVTGSTTVISIPAITGSVAVVNTPLITGSVAVVNTPLITGSVAVVNVPAVTIPAITGSVAVVNTPTITGSVSVVDTPTVTGSVAVVNTPTITGSVSVIDTPTVTGSVAVVNTPTITGSVAVVNTPTVTGSVSVIANVHPTGPTTLTGGRQTVAATGSAVSIGTLACYKVLVVGETDNTGLVVVGGTTTTIAVLATREGVPIYNSQSQFFECTNLNQIYLDVTVAGEGITFLAYT